MELLFLSATGAPARARPDEDARFAAAETEYSTRLAGWRTDAADRRRRIRISALQEFNREFVAALLLADVPIEEFGKLDSDGLEKLIESVPALWTVTELRRVRRANPAQAYKVGDLSDLKALAVAVVYCDVVVTDKAWVDTLRRTDLADRFQTTIGATLDGAAETILAW